MQKQLCLDYLTTKQAAEFLGCDQENLKHFVAAYKLRCGIFVPGWTGHAMPVIADGHHYSGGVCDRDSEGTTYSFDCANTEERFKVRHGYIAQFWFLEENEAYKLATSSSGEIDVSFLSPLDGESLNKLKPEYFPWPRFFYWVDNDQDESRRITWDRILFRKCDIDELIGSTTASTLNQNQANPLLELANKTALEIDKENKVSLTRLATYMTGASFRSQHKNLLWGSQGWHGISWIKNALKGWKDPRFN